MNPLDYLGNPLTVGDRVVFMDLHYKEFRKATITKINAKKVTILPYDPIYIGGSPHPTVRYFDQIINLGFVQYAKDTL